MSVSGAADLIPLRQVGTAAALRGRAMTAAAALQVKFLTGGDGVGLAGYRILEILLLVRSLTIEETQAT